MTSKHLFFKAMREDLRHKTWMLALSILGSFIVLPVAWLVYRDNMGNYNDVDYFIRYVTEHVMEFFSEYVMLMGGIFTGAGALITGLFGFRFLHHKNMVDTWHSMPIRRAVLFGACWLDGFLLWFVPFATAMLVTCLMAAGTLIGVGATDCVATMITVAGTSFLVLFIMFLLIYNLILVAVMLSGNVLNTLVSMGILGFGFIGIYGLCIAFFATYMSTFHYSSLDPEMVVYFSPLFSAGYLIYVRLEYAQEYAKLFTMLGLNLLVAAVLAFSSWLLYQRRSSELAEQGIKNKPLIALMKFIVSFAAGMSGWMLLSLIVNKYSMVWGIFGCVLVSVIVFGILDIIFHMDFKAFFRHKAQMGIAVASALFMCFVFYFDWIGYDAYLPAREDIAEFALYSGTFSNRYYHEGDTDILKRIHIQDIDSAYDFLDRAVENATAKPRTRLFDQYTYGETINIPVRVKLKSGKTYYREYSIRKDDKDVLWPLITSEEYGDEIYRLDERTMTSCWSMQVEREDLSFVLSERAPMVAIMEAYNRDLHSDPERVIVNEGRLMAQIEINVQNNDGDNYYTTPRVYLDVYEDMQNTVATIKELGYGKWVEDIDVSEITEIRLRLGFYPEYEPTPEQLIDFARSYYYYGVYEWGETEAGIVEEGSADMYYYEGKTQKIPITMEYEVEPYVSITDKNEMEELIGLMSYQRKYRSSIFDAEPRYTEVIAEKGQYYGMRMPVGVLPEKYILRFGELNLEDFGSTTQETYLR